MNKKNKIKIIVNGKQIMVNAKFSIKNVYTKDVTNGNRERETH